MYGDKTFNHGGIVCMGNFQVRQIVWFCGLLGTCRLRGLATWRKTLLSAERQAIYWSNVVRMMKEHLVNLKRKKYILSHLYRSSNAVIGIVVTH